MRDMLSAGIALYDEFPEMYDLAANRFFGGFLPVRNWWYQGHAFHQGTSYAETRFSADLYPLWIFDRLGAGNVYNPAQQFVPYESIYQRRPDGRLLRGGDGQGTVPKLRSLLTASYYGDGYLLGDYMRTPGIDAQNLIFELLWRDPDLQPRAAAELPLSRYMGNPYGWMIARSGWDDAKRDRRDESEYLSFREPSAPGQRQLSDLLQRSAGHRFGPVPRHIGRVRQPARHEL